LASSRGTPCFLRLAAALLGSNSTCMLHHAYSICMRSIEPGAIMSATRQGASTGSSPMPAARRSRRSRERSWRAKARPETRRDAGGHASGAARRRPPGAALNRDRAAGPRRRAHAAACGADHHDGADRFAGSPS
jgi:hypothetical protein